MWEVRQLLRETWLTPVNQEMADWVGLIDCVRKSDSLAFESKSETESHGPSLSSSYEKLYTKNKN